jgi:hypothetical protein
MALTLWLVDRSRSETGTNHCRRARYLNYHAGPGGYGWSRKAQSIPTLTGTRIHDPIAQILLGVKFREDALVQAKTPFHVEQLIPDDKTVHAILEGSIASYNQVVETRGLSNILDANDLHLRTMEQLSLLEGLVWAFVRVTLPAFLAEWSVESLEMEEVSVVGCTCGLGDLQGMAEDHDAKGCDGIGWMTRADIIGRHRTVANRYSYHEIKTTADANKGWEEGWAYRIQLAAGVLGTESRKNIRIDEVYVHGLIKGPRKSEWNPEEKKASGPKYQQSNLVYGGRRQANPPLYGEDWSVKWGGQFQWDDVLQKNKKVPKEYERTGIWELPASLWQENGALSPLHYWTQWMGVERLAAMTRTIGPIYREDWKLEQYLRQLGPEEHRWKGVLWALYEVANQGFAWASPEFQAELDRLVPMSRGEECKSYYGEKCEFLPICDRVGGWQDPEGLLGYIPRRPHHAPELAQAIARGLILPETGAGEDVLDEGDHG